MSGRFREGKPRLLSSSLPGLQAPARSSSCSTRPASRPPLGHRHGHSPPGPGSASPLLRPHALLPPAQPHPSRSPHAALPSRTFCGSAMPLPGAHPQPGPPGAGRCHPSCLLSPGAPCGSPRPQRSLCVSPGDKRRRPAMAVPVPSPRRASRGNQTRSQAGPTPRSGLCRAGQHPQASPGGKSHFLEHTGDCAQAQVASRALEETERRARAQLRAAGSPPQRHAGLAGAPTSNTQRGCF